MAQPHKVNLFYSITLCVITCCLWPQVTKSAKVIESCSLLFLVLSSWFKIHLLLCVLNSFVRTVPVFPLAKNSMHQDSWKTKMLLLEMLLCWLLTGTSCLPPWLSPWKPQALCLASSMAPAAMSGNGWFPIRNTGTEPTGFVSSFLFCYLKWRWFFPLSWCAHLRPISLISCTLALGPLILRENFAVSSFRQF